MSKRAELRQLKLEERMRKKQRGRFENVASFEIFYRGLRKTIHYFVRGF